MVQSGKTKSLESDESIARLKKVQVRSHSRDSSPQEIDICYK